MAAEWKRLGGAELERAARTMLPTVLQAARQGLCADAVARLEALVLEEVMIFHGQLWHPGLGLLLSRPAYHLLFV